MTMSNTEEETASKANSNLANQVENQIRIIRRGEERMTESVSSDNDVRIRTERRRVDDYVGQTRRTVNQSQDNYPHLVQVDRMQCFQKLSLSQLGKSCEQTM